MKAFEPYSKTCVRFRVLTLQPLRDDIQLCLGLLNADASLHPADRPDKMPTAKRHSRIVERERQPDIHCLLKPEIGRHHARNRNRSTVKHDCFSEDCMIAAKLAQPQAMT